jgi:hypothetical protein
MLITARSVVDDLLTESIKFAADIHPCPQEKKNFSTRESFAVSVLNRSQVAKPGPVMINALSALVVLHKQMTTMAATIALRMESSPQKRPMTNHVAYHLHLAAQNGYRRGKQ